MSTLATFSLSIYAQGQLQAFWHANHMIADLIVRDRNLRSQHPHVSLQVGGRVLDLSL